MNFNNPWKDLKVKKGELRNARDEEDFGSSTKLYWSINEADCYSFVVGFNNIENIKPDLPKINGFIFEFKNDDRELQIWISLNKDEFLDIFILICSDLLRKIKTIDEEEPKAIIQHVKNTIIRWITCFQELKEKMLSKSNQIGILGELLFLEKIIDDGVPINEAIESWQSPSGNAEQDFTYNNILYEIKSTTQTNDKEISINSLEQLNIRSGKIYLIHQTFSVNDKEEGNESVFSLLSKVSDIRRKIGTGELSHENQKLFESKLIEYKYQDHEEYGKVTFSLTNRRYFIVNSTFPRITKNSISNLIQKASYTLNVSDLSEWEKKDLKIKKKSTDKNIFDIDYMSDDILETRDIEFKASFRYPYPEMPEGIRNDKNQLVFKLKDKEFKSKEEVCSFITDISLSEICAMLNTAGGVLVIGIHEKDNNKILCGIERELKDRKNIDSVDKYMRYINEMISQRLGGFYDYINVQVKNVKNNNLEKMICIIDISELPDTEYCLLKNNIYVRKGSSSVALNTTEIIHFVKTRK